jgi:uncharacterized peroxidase-related enzyme
MRQLGSVSEELATGEVKRLFDQVRAKLGMVPNIMRGMANSPAALEGYLAFSGALGQGALSAKLRERLALTVAESNGCSYCLAAHSALGKAVGLTDEEIQDSRGGVSPDRKVEAALRFARQVVEKRGEITDEEVAEVRKAGYGDAEIAEIVANVALNIYTNYFNHVANTEVDFPAVRELVRH